MIFTNFNEKTQGNYQCLYGPMMDKKINLDIKLKVLDENDSIFLVEVQPNELEVSYESNVSLNCNIIQPKISDTSNLKYIWYKDNRILENFNQKQIEFTISSFNQSGNYSCQVNHYEKKSEQAYSQIKVIQTIKKPLITSSKYEIDYQKSNLIVKEGDNITLNCLTNADNSQVYWYIATSDNKTEKNGKELVLSDINQNFNGIYECVVKIPEKEMRISIDLKVAVYEPIKLKITEKYENNILKLDCNLIQGLPFPKISWTKDGNDFENIHEIISPQIYSISINQTDKANFGTFKCIAKNYFESVYEEFDFGIKNNLTNNFN